MPPRASVYDVEDTVVFAIELVDFHQVRLDLLVELIGYACTTLVAWAWIGPLSAHWARLDDVGYVVERDL